MSNDCIERPSYYSIIPASVRYDKRLSMAEKVIYSEITALSNKEGYCWATNKYFSSLYDVNARTISRWINSLKDLGYIKVEIEYKSQDEIKSRKIWISDLSRIVNFPTINNTPNNIDKEDKPEKEEKYKDEIKEIIDYLNERADCRYRYNSEGNNKLIRARLNEGYSVDDFKRVIDNKVSDWIGTDWQKFIRPATLFSTGHFDQYLNQKNYVSPQNQVSSQNQVSMEEFERLKETTKAY